MRQLLRRLQGTGRGIAKAARRLLVHSRRFDVCCCGLSKTGTHSMAGIFENYRSAHHPDADTRLRLAIGYLKGEVAASVAERTLRRRDRHLYLEMESSSLAGILIEPLINACPNKRFILTIRGLCAWCDSWIDHNINSPPEASSLFGTLDLVRLRVGDFAATRFDSPLTERGFPPLPCYFQLWATHNTRVLETVPAQRLLVVKTEELNDRFTDIARWVGVPPQTLRWDRGRLFTAPEKHRVLATLDASYVRDTAQRFCPPLLEPYLAG